MVIVIASQLFFTRRTGWIQETQTITVYTVHYYYSEEIFLIDREQDMETKTAELARIQTIAESGIITPLKLPPRRLIDQTKLPGGLQSPRPMPNFTFDFAKATNEPSIAYFEATQLQYINELVSTELTKCFEKFDILNRLQSLENKTKNLEKISQEKSKITLKKNALG